MRSAIVNSASWRYLKELDNLCVVLNLIGDAIICDYYINTDNDCYTTYIKDQECDIDACDRDGLCIHGWDEDYCNYSWVWQEEDDCVCCADVPIRTMYVLSAINVSFLCLWIVCYIIFRVTREQACCYQFVYIYGTILHLTHTFTFFSMLFTLKMYNNYLLFNLIAFVFNVLSLPVIYERWKRYRIRMAELNKLQKEKMIADAKRRSLNKVANNLSDAELEARDIQAANTAKPSVPEGSLYDFRLNLASGAVSGWKGPEFSKSIYFGDIQLEIQNSIRNFILTTDEKNYNKIQFISTHLTLGLVILTIGGFITCMVIFAIESAYVAGVFVIIWLVYLYIRFGYLKKIRDIWKINVLNNLIIYVESDLPSLYNIRDPSLVFSLIKLSKNIRVGGSSKGDWYFIRVSKNDREECPMNTGDIETMMVTSYNSKAAQVAGNKEGVDVIGNNNYAKYSQNKNNGGSGSNGSSGGGTLIAEGPDSAGGVGSDGGNENVNSGAGGDANVILNENGTYVELTELASAPVGVEDNDAPPAYNPNLAEVNVNTGGEGGATYQ